MTHQEYKTLKHWQDQYEKYGNRHCALWGMDDGSWVNTVDCFSLRDQGYLRQEDGPYNHTSFYLTDKAIGHLHKRNADIVTSALEHARDRCREEYRRFEERRNNVMTSNGQW
jgi:hypothetical protein